jgi:type VI secretion system protein ImpA
MPEHGGYGLYRWQESREVENLQRKGVKEYERALKEGRLTPEAFDKSARESGIGWFHRVFEEIADARAAYNELAFAVEERFGESAPGLMEIRKTLASCHDVARRLLELCGGLPAPTLQPVAPDAPTGMSAGPQDDAPPALATAPAGGTGSRDDAVRKLIEAARYFRDHEPHSPVAPLAERAARWAGMTLEAWMGEVIKDKSTVEQLHDLLGIRR